MSSCLLPYWFCLYLVLVLSFTRAARNPLLLPGHLDLTVGSTNMMTLEAIFKSIFKPLPTGVHFSNYEANTHGSVLALLPQELWISVLMKSHPAAFWKWGLTCKWAAAFARDGKLGIFKKFAHPDALGILLGNGTIRLHNGMAPLLQIALQKFIHQNHPKNQPTPEAWYGLYKFWFDLCIRSADISIVQIPVKVFCLDGNHRAFLIPLREHLYSAPNMSSHHFYLPPKDEFRLFQRIDPRLVSSSVCVTTAAKNYKFSIPLLLDYIIPLYRTRCNISRNDIAMARFLIPQHLDGFRDYMKLLLWGVFFTSGTIRKNERKFTGPIWRFFKSLNINWNDICGGRPVVKQYEDSKLSLDEGHVKRIYIVAEQWDLSFKLIAENTPWFPLSQQILSGNIPDFLANPPSYSCAEMYKIIYNVDPVKMKLVGNKVEVDEAALQAVTTKTVENRVELDEAPAQAPRNKRAADDEPFAPAAKKQKLDGTSPSPQPSIMPSAAIDSEQTVQLSDQQLMEQIMNQIGNLRQLIEATQNATDGPQTDYSVHLQTLNILQSTVQCLNLAPRPIFHAPQQIIQVQPSNVYFCQQHGAYHFYDQNQPISHIPVHQAMPPQYMMQQQPFYHPQPQQQPTYLQIMQGPVAPLPMIIQPQQPSNIDTEMMDSNPSDFNDNSQN